LGRFAAVLVLALCSQLSWALKCDADNDGDIDRDDLALIQKATLARTPVSGADDPRDADNNGVIDSIDGRICALRCTRASCATNSAPLANAGPDQTVRVTELVTLNGRASSDPDGNPITYAWSLTNRPAGSTAVLAGANTVAPTFTVDKPGSYVASLVVNDGKLNSAPDTVTITTENSRPVANAGPDQTAPVGTLVTLDGSRSSDVDGDALSYAWRFVTVPAGSTAALNNAAAVNPGFTIDRAGDYTIELLVSDGRLTSAADLIVVSTSNSAPVANAGPDQTVLVGDTVTLSGAASSDVDGNALAYAWSLLSRPAGSSAALQNPTAVMPTFVADRAGSYVIQLIVNDGTLNSAPDSVVVNTGNTPPVARAGNDQTVPLGAVVQLDGSQSSDVDGNALSFAWSLTTRPAGSAAVLSNPSAVAPSFTADAPGSYVAQLIVNDGVVNSAPSTVTITTQNAAPTARAGQDQTVALGAVVQLDGSASSDPEGAPLTFAWSLVSKPAGSTAALTGAATATPSFTADKAGSYVAQLIVSDGTLASAPASVTISTINSRPVADAGAAQNANTGATVQLDGSGSRDADGDALTYAWSLTTRPAGSAAVLNNPALPNPSFVADVAGLYVAQLIVSDGRLASAPATVSITVTTPNRAPIAVAAATPGTVNVGSAVALSSAGSSDPDGNPITFAWSIAARPAGSNAGIAAPTLADTTFVPDVAGQYIVLLTVSDGSLTGTATATVTANAVNVNRPPVIVTVAPTVGTVGAPYVYDVDATDPDTGDTLSYSLTASPQGMLINAQTGLISWTPSPAQTGAQGVTVRATDAAGLFATQSFSINVGSAATPLQLAATLVPSIANPGETVTLTVLASGGNGGAITLSATLDGAPLALTAGVATFAAPAAGVHRVNVTASAAPVGGSAPAPQSKELILSVRNPGDTTAPSAVLTSPAADSEVLAPIDVTGTASDANLAYYQLLVRPAGTGSSAWVEIWRGLASVSNGVLGRLDPSRFANGVYELGLNVIDVNGRTTSTLVPIEIARERKLGAFRLSFTDIRADAAGMPLTLTRTYDSLKKDQLGDFGWGWNADATDVSVRKNMILGLNWQLQTQGFNQCLRPVGNRRVTVTLPDGGVYRFQARNEPVCAFAVPPAVSILFDPLPLPVGGAVGAAAGGGTLQLTNLPSLVEFRGGVLFDWDELTTWNPKDFVFTSAEGARYTLREGVGVLSMTDRYGNTVTYGPGGYQHNAALAVQLVRDAQGRITRATDPAGRSITYAYNAAGELASLTDRLGQVTYFLYDTATAPQGSGDSGSTNSAHLLATIIDPRGIAVGRQQFDQFGRLIGSTDGSGQTTTQSFDETTNQQRVVDPRGNATIYTFDAAGNVTRIVDALGGVTDLSYDVNGNELTRRDPLGNVSTKTYNGVTGVVLAETDPLGRTTTTAYPASGREFERQNPVSVTDPLGRVVSIGYVAGDQTVPGAVPSSYTEPLGRVLSMGQDARGNLTSLGVGGVATTYGYDAQGRRISETDGRGVVTTYSFDSNGNELTRSVTRMVGGVPRVETTTRVYDSENRLIQETDATGAVRRTTYNAAGQVATRVDSLGRTTTYAYDANSRLVRTDFPDGTSEQATFDANGNKIAMTDRVGRVTRMVYDALNRHVQTLHPDGTSSSKEYDAAGRMTAEVDANGARKTFEYDAAGQLSAQIDDSGRRTQYSYDAAGNRIQTRLPDGRVVGYTFDALNRLTRTDFPDGSALLTAYRPDSRRASETDQRGVVSTFGYDANGRLSSVGQSGLPATTVFAYDEAGSKISTRDALSRLVVWRYDAAGRPVSRALPDGAIETFSYDIEGRAIGKTTFGGQTILRQYDAVGRETRRTIGATFGAPMRTIDWTYTADGMRATQTEVGPASSQGVTTFVYDSRNRLVSLSSPQGDLAWAYDAVGRVTRRTTPEGSTSYEYDADGRLTRMVAPDAKATVYSYDPAGRLVRSEQQLDAGATIALVTERRYDAQDRPVAIAHGRRVGAVTALIAGQSIARGAGGAVVRIDTYDAAGSFDAASGAFAGTPIRIQTFGYDANARLMQENNYKGAQLAAFIANPSAAASQAMSYAYDAVGNRVGKTVVTPAGTDITTYSYDVNDRLTGELLTTSTGSTIATAYTWDGNGNLASKSAPGEYTGFVFDADNRLVEVRRGPNQAGAAVVVSYGYDANGRRIRKTTPAGTTSYLIDPTMTWPQVALETGATHRVAYVWGDGLEQQVRGPRGSVFAAPTEDLIPLTGHLGTTIGAADRSGTLVESYEATATGDQGNVSTRLNHQFTGEYRADETGLTYLRERWYSPSTATFLSIDPAPGRDTVPPSLNRYAYAHGDPANLLDPTGAFLGLAGGFVDISFSHFQTAYARQRDAKRAYNTYNSIRNSLCKAGTNVSAMFKHAHHSFPKYLGGPVDDGLVLLAEELHRRFHSLLSILLKVNGYAVKSGKAFASFDPSGVSDVLEILKLTTIAFDAACKGVPGYDPIYPYLKPLLP
jgi:RHS repeat-associated protein